MDACQIYNLTPSASLFRLNLALQIGRVVVCALAGALVALVAKRVEMIAVVALVTLQLLLFLGGTIALVEHGHEWMQWFMVMLPWNLMGCLAGCMGGVIVRRRRHPVASRPSTA